VNGFLSVRFLEEKRKTLTLGRKKENAEVKEDTAIAAS